MTGLRGAANQPGGGGLTYLWRAEFDAAQSPPMPASFAVNTGLLNKYADTGDNARIASGQFQIPAVVGNVDPAYHGTQADGSGFPRVTGRALIAYAQGTPWIGLSNSTTLATSALIYGAKERSAVVAGVEKSEALAIGDPAHIIILRNTGALHVCRIGLQDYLCYPYRNGNDATLWPAILGSVCNYDAGYIYDVTPPNPTTELTGAISQGDAITHTLSTFLFEVTVTTRSNTADTRVAFGLQDSNNYLFLNISPAGALNLVRRVAGSNTTEKAIFGNGVVVSGSHIVVQFKAPSPLASGGGNTFKLWCGSSYYDSTIGATAQGFIDANSGGSVILKPSDCTLNNLACWPIVL